LARREIAIGSSESPFVFNRIVDVVGRPNVSFGLDVFVCAVIRTAVGILANHRRSMRQPCY
jgi:hypothetical protein